MCVTARILLSKTLCCDSKKKYTSIRQQRFLLQPFLARIAAVAVQTETARGNQDRVPKREDERDREFHVLLSFLCV